MSRIDPSVITAEAAERLVHVALHLAPETRRYPTSGPIDILNHANARTEAGGRHIRNNRCVALIARPQEGRIEARNESSPCARIADDRRADLETGTPAALVV